MNRDFQLNHDILNKIRNAELEQFRRQTLRSTALFEESRRLMPNGVPCSWMSAFYPGTDLFAASGKGAYIEDVDGNRYLDMTQCDLSMVCGYGPEPVSLAVAERFANGSHFLMPTEDAIAASQLLADRFGQPFWQFTLSASTANVEAIRISRALTGRDKVVTFSGKYLGHFDEALIERSGNRHIPSNLGLPRSATDSVVEVPFNDPDALDMALRAGDIACVLTEPVMTNLGVVYPEHGFHDTLRRLTWEHDVVLIIDETHTQAAVYGGFTRLWQLQPDILTLGKCVGGGVPIGCYGLAKEIGEFVEANTEPAVGEQECLALGGTTYGNALNMAAARATLEHVLTKDAYERVLTLGDKLADGIESLIEHHGFPWRTVRLGNRSGICLAPDLPRNAEEARKTIDRTWNLATRAFLANRGIWEPIYIHGPSVSFAHNAEDIDLYLSVLDGWLERVKLEHNRT